MNVMQASIENAYNLLYDGVLGLEVSVFSEGDSPKNS